MKFHVVVNPAGASGRTGAEWAKLERLFQESNTDYEVRCSSREHGIGAICGELEQEAARNRGAGSSSEPLTIVVCGGDGSLNEAVNGVKHPGRIRFGLLPCGSGNDFARDLGMDKKPLADITRDVLRGQTAHTFDIGEIEYADDHSTRRFVVSCGIGFDAAICELAGRSKYKDFLNHLHLGSLIYISSAFRVIREQHCLPVTVEADGRTYHFDHLLFVCGMNHRFEGGGYQFAPEADASDSILDLCLADPPHNSDFYRVFPSVPGGRHYEKWPTIMHAIRGHEAQVRTSIPLWVHTDGEVRRRADHIIMRISDEKLQILNH